MTPVSYISESFWNDRFWFPPGVTWESLESSEAEKFPQASDLHFALLVALFIIFLRIIVEWTLLRPLGRFLGVPDLQHPDGDFYRKVARFLRLEPTHNEVLKKTTMKPGIWQKSKLDKFSECSFKALYYCGSFVFGLKLVVDREWFWDTTRCWHGWPFQTVDDPVRWFYLIQCSFYLSETISQFVDVKRKDFWIMFIHHVATVSLIYLSWVCNFVRIGVLTLALHDAADPWIEFIKITRYCNFTNVCNLAFAIFAVVWTVTRLVIFPLKVIYSSAIETVALHGFSGAYYVFIPLFVVLQVLHLIWTKMIWDIVKRTVAQGEFEDVRSDSDSD